MFAQSAIWGINAFDQWGVELGKKLADSLAPAIERGQAGDASEALGGVLEYIAKWRQPSAS